jgi:1-acyl-sn-glycerol-3-phosphate acyltransferase
LATSSRFTGTTTAHGCASDVTSGILAIVPQRIRLGFWYRFVIVVVKPFLRMFTTRDWHGAENLPHDGGIIVVANHVSEVDPLMVADYLLHAAGRPPRFLAKKELFRKPPLKWVLEGAEQIPVDRGSVDAARALSAAVDALARGECILIYPEGSATRDPALWPMKSRTGAARLALLSGAPVIPIAQWGPQRVLAYKARKPHLLPRTRISVLAGPAVDLSAYVDKPVTADLLRNATTTIMGAVVDLLEQLRDEQAPEDFYDAESVVTTTATVQKEGA